MIERIKRDGFEGLPMLLGLREDEQQGHPQLAGV